MAIAQNTRRIHNIEQLEIEKLNRRTKNRKTETNTNKNNGIHHHLMATA